MKKIIHQSTNDSKTLIRDGVFVCLQSFSGLVHSGLFYSWGALIVSINGALLGKDVIYTFSQDYGLFAGVIILCLNVVFMTPLRMILDTKIISEFTCQAIGVVMVTIGFILGGISLKYKMVWLLFVGCATPCGIGGLCLYQRLIFNHQYYFKSVGWHNIGSGIFGFAIGFWTVIFILLSVPFLDSMDISNVLFLYAAILVVSMSLPLFTINDEANIRMLNNSISFRVHHHSNHSTSNYITNNNHHHDTGTGNATNNHVVDSSTVQESSVEVEEKHDSAINPYDETGKENKKKSDSRNVSFVISNKTAATTSTTSTSTSSFVSYKQQIQQYLSSYNKLPSNRGPEKENNKSINNGNNAKIIIDNNHDDDDEHKADIEMSQPQPQSASFSSPTTSEKEQIHQQEIIHRVRTDGRTVDDNGHYELTYTDVIYTHQTYILIFFFVCVITPGWGIKLASFSMLENLFNASLKTASEMSALYVSFYAIGRLCSGLVAEYLGVWLTYDIMIGISLILLAILPTVAMDLPHDTPDSPGFKAFITLLCFIGLMYGGSMALFYSIIFDVFGPRNYRSVFSVAVVGFGIAVLIGGLSSAYSFQPQADGSVNSDEVAQTAASWFYAMTGCCLAGLILLHSLTPYDYSKPNFINQSSSSSPPPSSSSHQVNNNSK